MQERYVLQADAVAIRLVQSVPQLQVNGIPVPSGPGVGSQVSVLGTNYVPSWAGINGPRGWSTGTIELRLYEEGAWQMELPNAAGEDGLLHRLRLLITVAGKATPTGGSVTLYAGGMFRPGDEFIEIYRTTAAGAPGKAVFVGCVTKATIDSGKIVLEGSDGLWLLKKTRETAAGFFVNAPRDVCEHYTRVKRALVADDFPQDSRFSFSGGSRLTTSDGQWVYDHAYNVLPSANGASTWSPALGSAVRLGTPGTGGTIRAAAAVPITFEQQADPLVRWEAEFRWAPGFNVNDVLYLGFGTGFAAAPSAAPATGGPSIRVYAGAGAWGPGGTAVVQNGAGQFFVLQGQNFSPSSWHTIAIEVRDRYILGYLDGGLIGIVPQVGALDAIGSAGASASAYLLTASAPSGTGHCLADVDYAVLRQWVPGMLRPADPTKLGDYSLGGVPAQGSCLVEVWRTDDTPPFGLEFSPARSAANGVGFTGKFSAPSPSLGPTPTSVVPGWWPSAAGGYAGRFALRASGSLYLTLGTYDYRLRMTSYAGRLWLARTRLGEQLIDTWQQPSGPTTTSQSGMTTPYLKAASIGATTISGTPAAGATSFTVAATPAGWSNGMLLRLGNAAPYEYVYALTASLFGTITLTAPLARSHANGEAVVAMNQGSLSGQPSGWYPFIMEAAYDAALWANEGGHAVLQYERSDQPNWWANAGAAPYVHGVYAAVGPGNPNGITASAYWPLNSGVVAGGNLASYVGSAGLSFATFLATTQQTLVPGDSALLLNGGITAGRTGDSLNAGPGGLATPTGPWVASVLAQPLSTAGIQTLFRKEASLGMRFNGTSVEVLAWHGGTLATLSWAVGVVAGTWYHLLATWDGTNVRLYVNGALFGSPQALASQDDSANALYLGATTGTTDWLNGALGHFFLGAGALAASPIATLYGTATALPHVLVSQSGVVDTTEQPYRYVSHYDQLLQTVKDWGLQITAEPMQLESGEFPARLRPLLRVGRSTEYKVGSPQVRLSTATDVTDAITAEEVADALVADAQGLADPTGASQVSAEVFNFPGMVGPPAAGAAPVPLHAWLSEEYDQSNDIAYPALLFQRLLSMLALRGAPWEQVSLVSKAERQLLDTFPLTGAPAEFFWGPGDGVRLDFPELGVEDQQTRQVLGVSWPITPGGFGSPSISLRQRPRNFAQVLREMTRRMLAAQRAYQGQLVILSGHAAGNVGYADTYSRVSLPMNLTNVVSGTFAVHHKSDASSWQVEVNDSTNGAPTFTRTGRYDVTGLVSKLLGDPRMYARATGGTGTCSYSLELLVRV